MISLELYPEMDLTVRKVTGAVSGDDLRTDGLEPGLWTVRATIRDARGRSFHAYAPHYLQIMPAPR